MDLESITLYLSLKMDIFHKTVDEIFTTPRLIHTLLLIKDKAKDYKEVSQNIKDGFIPSPVKRFEIDKNEFEKRELILSSTYSKILPMKINKN